MTATAEVIDAGPPTAIVSISPYTILDNLSRVGADPSTLERIVALIERTEDRQAQRIFAEAITGFQSEMAMVKKRRTTKAKEGSDFQYDFASYDDVWAMARPLLAKYKIVVTFDTKFAEARMDTTCRVRVGTHSELTTVTMPIPNMKANDTQKFGGAISYGKRYSLCAALNIVVTDEDDDAATQFDNLTDDEAKLLADLIREKKVDESRFLAWASEACGPTEKVTELPRAFFAKAHDMLKRKQVSK